MEIGCQFCGTTVADCDDNCRCRTTHEGFDNYNPFTLINGYRPSTIDQITVHDDGSIHDETFEFVFCHGVEFSVSLEKDFDMGKVVIRLRQTHEKVEEALCPTHNADLWESPEKYYCQAKSDDGASCPVEVSRRYATHEVTRAELVELFDGIPLLWELERKNGSGTYSVLGYWDWDNNHFVIEPTESCP